MAEPDAAPSKDEWGPPIHVEPGGKETWGAPVHSGVIDDVEHGASAGTIARASLPPDEKIQIKRYAEAFKQPLTDFAVIDGNIVRKLPGTDQYARVQPSVRGSTGPIDAVERAAHWVAGGAGPAMPTVAGMVGGTLAALAATPETAGIGAVPAAMAAAGASAAAAETARQKLDAVLAREDGGEEAPFDLGNVGWQAGANAAGPLLAKPLQMAGRGILSLATKAGEAAAPAEVQSAVAAGREAAGVAASTGAADTAANPASFGLSDRVVSALKEHIQGREAELEQLRQDAQSMGVDLSLSQLTGSEAVKQAERQLMRQPETVQKVVDLREAQNTKQLPGAVRGVMDDIAPDAPAGSQVESFREGAQGVVKKALKERSAAAEIAYGEANRGGSIAPLEDQFRDAVQQATAEKGRIMKQIADIEKNQSGALASRGAAGQSVRDQYMALREQASEVEEARQAMLERLNQAKVDKTAGAPGAVWSPRLQEFLNDPDIRPGIARGLQIERLEALARGEKFNPTEFAIVGPANTEDGMPVIGSVPNMKLLHAAKKGIDAIIADNTDEFGRVNSLGRAAKLVQDAYLKELDRLNPAYGIARKQFAEDSTAIDMVKNGGVGFLNKITGLDRQQIVNRIFSGDNVMPDDIAAMRRQFIYAGKGAEWNNGVRSYIADALADAVAPLKSGGTPNNVGGSLYKNLFEDRQAAILKAAMGSDNPALIARWNKLGDVLKAASHQLPEGAPTATDINAPGLMARTKLAAKLVLKPTSVGPELLEGLEQMQKPEQARKMAETLLTPKGDGLLKALSVTTPGSDKANSLLVQMFTQAGLVSAVGAAGRAYDGWNVEKVQ